MPREMIMTVKTTLKENEEQIIIKRITIITNIIETTIAKVIPISVVVEEIEGTHSEEGDQDPQRDDNDKGKNPAQSTSSHKDKE